MVLTEAVKVLQGKMVVEVLVEDHQDHLLEQVLLVVGEVVSQLV